MLGKKNSAGENLRKGTSAKASRISSRKSGSKKSEPETSTRKYDGSLSREFVQMWKDEEAKTDQKIALLLKQVTDTQSTNSESAHNPSVTPVKTAAETVTKSSQKSRNTCRIS